MLGKWNSFLNFFSQTICICKTVIKLLIIQEVERLPFDWFRDLEWTINLSIDLVDVDAPWAHHLLPIQAHVVLTVDLGAKVITLLLAVHLNRIADTLVIFVSHVCCWLNDVTKLIYLWPFVFAGNNYISKLNRQRLTVNFGITFHPTGNGWY